MPGSGWPGAGHVFCPGHVTHVHVAGCPPGAARVASYKTPHSACLCPASKVVSVVGYRQRHTKFGYVLNFGDFLRVKLSLIGDLILQTDKMNEENYLLKWNDFDKNLSEGLRSLKSENTFCDVTLACEESSLEAHRVVLSVCSDFFRGVLTRTSHHHPYLYMKGVRMADMETILHFMYHGEANVALEDLESFLAAANELQIKGLTAPSVNQFKKSLSQDKEEPSSPQPPPSKKVKKEKVETSSEKQSNITSRSVLKRRNTDSSVGEESRVKEEYKVQLVDPDLPDETFEQSELTPYDDSIQDYIQDADGSNYSLEDGSFSGTQGDTASGDHSLSFI